MTLWDVWGFFQESFLAALDYWLPADPDYAFIRDWKGKRSEFERGEIDTIRRYNAAELRCLALMMNKVRDAIRNMGLTVSRWDGAGAISGAMLKHNNVKNHMRRKPAGSIRRSAPCILGRTYRDFQARTLQREGISL